MIIISGSLPYNMKHLEGDVVVIWHYMMTKLINSYHQTTVIFKTVSTRQKNKKNVLFITIF